MASWNRDLRVDAGASFGEDDHNFVWKAGDPLTPVNLTGCTAKMQIRLGLDTPVLLELTTENGGIALSSTGKVVINMTATQTAALPPKSLYQLEITMTNGRVRRLLTGFVIVSPELVKP